MLDGVGDGRRRIERRGIGVEGHHAVFPGEIPELRLVALPVGIVAAELQDFGEIGRAALGNHLHGRRLVLEPDVQDGADRRAEPQAGFHFQALDQAVLVVGHQQALVLLVPQDGFDRAGVFVDRLERVGRGVPPIDRAVFFRHQRRAPRQRPQAFGRAEPLHGPEGADVARPQVQAADVARPFVCKERELAVGRKARGRIARQGVVQRQPPFALRVAVEDRAAHQPQQPARVGIVVEGFRRRAGQQQLARQADVDGLPGETVVGQRDRHDRAGRGRLAGFVGEFEGDQPASGHVFGHVQGSLAVDGDAFRRAQADRFLAGTAFLFIHRRRAVDHHVARAVGPDAHDGRRVLFREVEVAGLQIERQAVRPAQVLGHRRGLAEDFRRLPFGFGRLDVGRFAGPRRPRPPPDGQRPNEKRRPDRDGPTGANGWTKRHHERGNEPES